MELNRNIDFDSDVEMNSLKDAVWRLTTRVYLLEDFIAERFGEVLSPSGFTKTANSKVSSTPIPNVSPSKINILDESSDNISVSSYGKRRDRKRRKKRPVVRPGVEQSHNNKQKIPRTSTFGVERDLMDPLNTLDPLLNSGDSPKELMLIPKSEVSVHDDSDELDGEDAFLNDESESTNDSKEKDPDYHVFLGSRKGDNDTKYTEECADQYPNNAKNRPISISCDPEYCIDTKNIKWSTYYNYIGHTGKLNILWQCNQCSSKVSVSATSKSNAKRHYSKAHKIDIRNIKKIIKIDKK